MKRGRTSLLALLIATSGCAHTGVSLLPGEKGSAGSVAVLDPKTGADIGIIDQANSRTGIGAGGKLSTKAVAAATMEQRFGSLMSDMPEAPKLFVLYFREGSTQLVDESTALVPELFEETKRRPGADVQVVGHTDTVGDPTSNDTLSVRRAEQVREMLVSMGMIPAIVRATGRGEREPLEPTGDEVASVFNRRVEVFVK
jgi:outer membrane protein OmpA-like peptidoglycan-associated protein